MHIAGIPSTTTNTNSQFTVTYITPNYSLYLLSNSEINDDYRKCKFITGIDYRIIQEINSDDKK